MMKNKANKMRLVSKSVKSNSLIISKYKKYSLTLSVIYANHIIKYFLFEDLSRNEQAKN